MREEFDDALKEDHGYNSFMSTMAAHSILEPEVEHIISNMNSWAKTQSISTPLGLGMACSSLVQ